MPCLFRPLRGASSNPTLAVYRTESLCALHAADGLVFSENEPAINVYYENGCFLPHEDHCALTVLIPLTSPGAATFSGGGTGFWAADERRYTDACPIESEEGMAPSIVLAPDAGTAMLFSGDVTHAGMEVETGTRVVLVASFSRKWQILGCQQRAECFPFDTWS